MKLYGLASAFLHDKNDDSILHIHCNPISMTDGKREDFELVGDLAYKDTVDLTDIEATCKAFTRFINTWEEVVRRQHDGLDEKHKDLPIAFLAGDADFNKININALFIAFFGKRFSERDDTARGLSEAEMKHFMLLLENVTKKMDNNPDYDNEIKRDPEAITAMALMEKIGQRGRDSSRKMLVRAVAKARKAYIEEHGSYPPEFIEACAKLPGLLDASFYHHGRFSNNGRSLTGAPPDFDDEIASLEKPFKYGSPRATARLEEIAAALGTYYGTEYTYGSKVFKIPGPKNFSKDPDLQAQHPELAFFHWEDAAGRMPFYKAFHEAFREANWHPSYRFMKLPMDGDKPLYTDPVADMMVELHQIATGTRARFSIEETHEEPIYKVDHQHKALVSELAERTYHTELRRQARANYAARFIRDEEFDEPKLQRRR